MLLLLFTTTLFPRVTLTPLSSAFSINTHIQPYPPQMSWLPYKLYQLPLYNKRSQLSEGPEVFNMREQQNSQGMLKGYVYQYA